MANVHDIVAFWFAQCMSQHWSENDQVVIRQRVIIWTNDGLSYWRIYSSFGLSELTLSSKEINISLSHISGIWVQEHTQI